MAAQGPPGPAAGDAALDPVDGARRVSRAIPEEARRVALRIAEAGHRTVFVGGGVRDALLGRPVAGAWDLATAAPPDRVRALFPHAVPTGLAHGTVTLPEPGGALEITTFRTEGAYTDARRPDHVQWVAELAVDLARRDFTLNAIAFDPVEERIVDVVGGLADLAAGRLCAVGEPAERFREDALRTLRAARFVSTHGFALEERTRAALGGAADRLRRISAERVRDELDRLLLGAEPGRGLETLREAGLLGVVLPEIERLIGVEQNRHHRWDVYRHTLETVNAAVARRRVRWAALFHDAGKPGSRAVREDGEATFHGHAGLGAEIADRALRRLRFPRREREVVVLLVREHLFDYREEWSGSAVRRFLRRVGTEHLDDLFDLRRADIAGTGVAGDEGSITALRRRIDEERAAENALRVEDLAIDGRRVMAALGLEPGPEVGRLLRRLLEEVIEDPSRNTPERLLERLPRLHRDGGDTA